MENQEPTTEATKKQPAISIPAAIITGAAIIGIALLIIFSPKHQAAKTAAPDGTPTSVPADVATVRATDHIRGDAKTADVVIFEYSDSDCPFCVQFHPTLQEVFDDYKEKVAWVYRFFPLNSLHPNAYTEAEALECVATIGGNDAFNKYLDTIINVTLQPNPESNASLLTFAQAQGIDPEKLKACMPNAATAARINGDIAEAQAIGAKGTPFSIAVNVKTGKQTIIPGAYPIAAVKQIIDDLLK